MKNHSHGERALSTGDDSRQNASEVSRGTIAAGLLAAPAAALPLPARAAGMHRDVALLALFAQWEASAVECERTVATMDVAEDRYVAIAPTLPEAMYWREGDEEHVGYRKRVPYRASGDTGTRPWLS